MQRIITMTKLKFTTKLPVSIFKEGEYFIAHTPALDISTSGDTYDEVRKRFREVVEIFFEETVRKGTLEEVLREFGWTRVRKQWMPPVVISHEPQEVRIAIPA